MFKKLRIVSSLSAALVAGYSLMTENFKYQPAMMFFLSLMMLFMGLEEFQKENKAAGWFSIVAFLFIFFVFIQISLT